MDSLKYNYLTAEYIHFLLVACSYDRLQLAATKSGCNWLKSVASHCTTGDNWFCMVAVVGCAFLTF